MTAFQRFIKEFEPKWGYSFDKEDWRICSPGCPREGEFANKLLQQLREAFDTGYMEER